jgi:hypothetical protein
LSVEINNIIITLVIRPRLTSKVDPGPELIRVLKKIEEGLTWLDPLKNPGQPRIKH